jgi:hypothetical protein
MIEITCTSNNARTIRDAVLVALRDAGKSVADFTARTWDIRKAPDVAWIAEDFGVSVSLVWTPAQRDQYEEVFGLHTPSRVTISEPTPESEAEAAPVKTLATLNENAHESVWSDTYRLRDEIAVGVTGKQSSYRGQTGSKVHALRVSRIIEDLRPVDQRRADTYKLGDMFRVTGFCNGNGQQNGKINTRLDISDITCEKCRKALGL